MGIIKIQKTSIINLQTDAIVNAANKYLQAGGGVCGIIFNTAGPRELQEACDKIGKCAVGSAVITPAFKLKSKYIIHAVGPEWRDGKHKEPQLLYSAYKESLKLAVQNGCKSIGFPLISAGIFGYPVDLAWQKAIQACQDFQKDNKNTPIEITFAVIDDQVLREGLKVLETFKKEKTSLYLTKLSINSIRNLKNKMATQSDFLFDKKAYPMAGDLFNILCEDSILQSLSVEQLIRIINSIFPSYVLEEIWLTKYCDFMLRVIDIPNRKAPCKRAAKYENYLKEVLIPAQRKGAQSNDIWDDVDTLTDIYKVCVCLYRYYSKGEKVFEFSAARDDMERMNTALNTIPVNGLLGVFPGPFRAEDRQYAIFMSWLLQELLCVQEGIETEES